VTYAWVDHTAEVELVIDAASPEAAFEDALRAYAELVAPAVEGEPARHEVELTAPDRGALLAAWVDELVFLADTEAFVPHGSSGLVLLPNALRAAVEGVRDAPSLLVKAVTYHRLEWSEEPGRVRARLVLDV
jgi:SHS2 domain-containing protein